MDAPFAAQSSMRAAAARGLRCLDTEETLAPFQPPEEIRGTALPVTVTLPGFLPPAAAVRRPSAGCASDAFEAFAETARSKEQRQRQRLTVLATSLRTLLLADPACGSLAEALTSHIVPAETHRETTRYLLRGYGAALRPVQAENSAGLPAATGWSRPLVEALVCARFAPLSDAKRSRAYRPLEAWVQKHLPWRPSSLSSPGAPAKGPVPLADLVDAVYRSSNVFGGCPARLELALWEESL